MTEPLIREGLFTPSGVDAPVSGAAAALAQERLRSLLAARHRLNEPAPDGEALHDFRVALRRVRSVLRAYAPGLATGVPAALPRALRRLARATGPSRDLEVKLRWLAAHGAELRPRDQVGVRWLTRRLEAAADDARAKASKRIGQDFDRVTRALQDRLGRLEREASGGPSLAHATAEALDRSVNRLARRLGRVRSLADQREAHAARIAGKRVRYLLEPLVAVEPAAQEALGSYKAIQDLLGDLHDAWVLAGAVAEAMEAGSAERGQRVAERVRGGDPLDRAALRRERRRDPMPGLVALGRLAREGLAAGWTAFERDWMPHHERRLLAPARGVAASLAARWRPGIEVERKYLLRAMPPRVREVAPLTVDQGYLPGQAIRERLRRAREAGGAVRWYRTLKTGSGLVREEIEEETTEAVFDAMWPLTEGRRVRKRRYRVPAGDLVWEVDDFLDRALVLAEVELPTPAVEPVIPDWLVPYVTREVTGDPTYTNARLAR